MIPSPVTSLKKRSTAARVQRQIDQKMTDGVPSDDRYMLDHSQTMNKKDHIEIQIRA